MLNDNLSDAIAPILKEIERYRQKAKDVEAQSLKILKPKIKKKYGLSVKFDIFIKEPVGYRIKCVKDEQIHESDLALRLQEGKIFKIMLFPKDLEIEEYLEDLISKTDAPMFLFEAQLLFASLDRIEKKIKEQKQIKERIAQC